MADKANADERIAPTTPRSSEAGNPLLPSDAALQVKRGRLSAAQKAGVGAAAALSAALIAVSAYFIVAPAAEEPGSAAPSAAAQKAPSSGPGTSIASDEASPGGEAEGAGGADAAALADEPDAAGISDAAAAASPSPVPAPDAAAPAPAPEPSGPADQGVSAPERPAAVTVSVTVDSSAADGRVSGNANPTFQQGATAYDALVACGLSVNASSSPLGIYVSAIGGLAEKEYGGMSGWHYQVNGVEIGGSSGSCVLSDGDVVYWYYAL